MPAVLGAGISGLAAAYYLTKRYVNPLTIYESSNRIGGWIRTEKHIDKGFIFETGPRTIRPKGPAAANTLELLDDLGIQDMIQPINTSHPAAKYRMIYANNKLCMLPSSIFGIFKTIPPFSQPLIMSFAKDLFATKVAKRLKDESIYDFVERRFGNEIAKYAISSMICGICAGDAKEISVRFLMNDLFEQEQQFGGVIKGIFMNKILRKTPAKKISSSQLVNTALKDKWSIYSFKNGMEEFPKALMHHLKRNSVDLQIGSECKKISFTDKEAILDINGEEVITDHIFSSLPSHKLANIVEHQHPSLACQLKTIPYVTVAVCNLHYNSKDLLKHEAFGFLVPPDEKLPILGVIFDSCCFSSRGTVLTVMMGGKWFEEHFGKLPTQKQILDVALNNVKKILNIYATPKLARVNILKDCIPQYTVGHQSRVEGIRKYIKKYKLPLSICGAAYDGVGVNDVILSARNQVTEAIG